MSFFRIIIFVIFTLIAGHVAAADSVLALALADSAEKSFKSADYDTATKMCGRALDADPTCAKAHLLLGECFEKLNKPGAAIASYTAVIDFSTNGNEALLVEKAREKIRKLAPGLEDFRNADKKLIASLQPLADKAFADEQFDTASTAYKALVALGVESARDNLAKTERAIKARGDPVQAKMAAAWMAEVWYKLGRGEKQVAHNVASNITKLCPDTALGMDAASLLANNFEFPKNIGAELAMAKQELKTIQTKSVFNGSDTSRVPPAPSTVLSIAAPGIDVEATEKKMTDEVKLFPKDKLILEFLDCYSKGKAFFQKAAPGTQGNQRNLASALEQFIKCEALYLRISDEQLMNAEVDELEKSASMCRYSCMKMTILSN